MDDTPIVESLRVRGHTPGRWSVSEDGIPIGCKDVNVVARVYRKTINANHVVATIRHGSDQWEANACLIAAAPELIEALKECVFALNVKAKFKCGNTDSYAIAALADAAIRKAEGRGQ